MPNLQIKKSASAYNVLNKSGSEIGISIEISNTVVDMTMHWPDSKLAIVGNVRFTHDEFSRFYRLGIMPALAELGRK